MLDRKIRLGNNLHVAALFAAAATVFLSGICSAAQQPHNFSEADCPKCHLTTPVENDPGPYRFVAPVSALCNGCHRNLSAVSHFVNTSTDIAGDVSYPVVDALKINCTTCHDPHMPAINPNNGKRTYFLRWGAAERTQCTKCHPLYNSPQGLPTRRHVMDRAHGFANFSVNGEFTMDYTGWGLHIRDTVVKLDRLSVFCMGCHDNPKSRELASPGSYAYKHGADNGTSHPIGIKYDEAAWNNMEIRLKDRDARIPLFGGKIGCCSCHDPYKPGGGLGLRIGNRSDWHGLCQGCHIR